MTKFSSIALSPRVVAPLLVALCLLPSFAVLAGKKNVKNQKILTPKQEIQSYQGCRKKVLNKKKGASKLALARCRDQFPAASLMVECKRSALAKHKKQPKALREAIQSCKKRLADFRFNPRNPLPFILNEQGLFFGGVGLNLPQKFRRDGFGNFDCSHLDRYIRTGKQAEYLLFGNHFNVFEAFRDLPHRVALKKLGIKLKGPGARAEFQLNDNFGQIYDFKDANKTASYFPISHCFFDRKLGQIYDGLKIYYLSDRKDRLIAPYFGIAFYAPDSKIRVKELKQQVISALGPTYKVMANEKEFLYISDHEFAHFDPSGDPYNLCKEPRKHQYITLIRRRGSSRKPEYLVVANIANLCQFGERLARKEAQ